MKSKIFSIFLFVIGIIIIFQLIKLIGDLPSLTGGGASTQKISREINVVQNE